MILEKSKVHEFSMINKSMTYKITKRVEKTITINVHYLKNNDDKRFSLFNIIKINVLQSWT